MLHINSFHRDLRTCSESFQAVAKIGVFPVFSRSLFNIGEQKKPEKA
jgi:hypothetical protein